MGFIDGNAIEDSLKAALQTIKL